MTSCLPSALTIEPEILSPFLRTTWSAKSEVDRRTSSSSDLTRFSRLLRCSYSGFGKLRSLRSRVRELECTALTAALQAKFEHAHDVQRSLRRNGERSLAEDGVA